VDYLTKELGLQAVRSILIFYVRSNQSCQWQLALHFITKLESIQELRLNDGEDREFVPWLTAICLRLLFTLSQHVSYILGKRSASNGLLIISLLCPCSHRTVHMPHPGFSSLRKPCLVALTKKFHQFESVKEARCRYSDMSTGYERDLPAPAGSSCTSRLSFSNVSMVYSSKDR